MAAKKTPEERAQLAREYGKLGGRPPKYTAAELDAAITRYFDSFANSDDVPTWHDMLLKLGISEDTVTRYRNDEKYIEQGYADALKKATRLHCDFWQQYAVKHPNLQTFCMFELKQPHNGGFTDKPQGQTDQVTKIEFNITGLPDGANPSK